MKDWVNTWGPKIGLLGLPFAYRFGCWLGAWWERRGQK